MVTIVFASGAYATTPGHAETTARTRRTPVAAVGQVTAGTSGACVAEVTIGGTLCAGLN